MILNRDEILAHIKSGQILIQGFDPCRLGPNSYDVTLSDALMAYGGWVLDPRRSNPVRQFWLPEKGRILWPWQFWLGCIREHIWIGGYDLIPMIDGVSSLARLGLSIHQTAGRGDIGFSGKWTLELSARRPIRLRPDMRIAQITFERCAPCSVRYHGNYTDARMLPSQEWQRHREKTLGHS